MTQIETNSLRIEKTINAPIDKVRDALTNPELLQKWFAPGPMNAEVRSCDAKVGGQYEIAMTGPNPESGEVGTHTCSGNFTELTDTRVAMTFNWTEEPMPNQTELAFDLETVDGGTNVVLTHRGFPNEETAQHHTQGWEGRLANLESLLA